MSVLIVPVMAPRLRQQRHSSDTDPSGLDPDEVRLLPPQIAGAIEGRVWRQRWDAHGFRKASVRSPAWNLGSWLLDLFLLRCNECWSLRLLRTRTVYLIIASDVACSIADRLPDIATSARGTFRPGRCRQLSRFGRLAMAGVKRWSCVQQSIRVASSKWRSAVRRGHEDRSRHPTSAVVEQGLRGSTLESSLTSKAALQAPAGLLICVAVLFVIFHTPSSRIRLCRST
jgi:hypothetical protein